MPYTIYSSGVARPSGSVGTSLISGTATDKFVAGLNKSKKLVLAASPPSSEPIPLDDSDETAGWFAKIASTFSVLLVGPSNEVSSFTVEFADPVSLVFSSAPAVLVSAFGADGPAARISPPGLDKDGTTLACGLDFDGTFADIESLDTTVESLFDFAGLNRPREFLPDKVADMPVSLRESDKAKGPRRNALWFVPAQSCLTVIRLQFSLGLADSMPLQKAIETALPSFKLKSTEAVVKRKLSLAQTELGPLPLANGEVTFAIECSVQAKGGPEVNMAASIEFSATVVTLTFMFTSQEDPIEGILLWLAEVSSVPGLKDFVMKLLGKSEGDSKVLSKIAFRRLIIGLDPVGHQNNPSLVKFAFDVEALATFGTGQGQPPAAFLMSYAWNKEEGGLGAIRGEFWGDYDATDAWQLSPLQERWTVLQPSLGDKRPAEYIELAYVIPFGHEVADIPDCVPSQIRRAYIVLSDKKFAIGGTITAKKLTENQVPQPQLGQLALDASFAWGASSEFKLDLIIGASLSPSKYSKHQTTAVLRGALHYDKLKDRREWSLKASLTGFYASTLVEFFDSDAKDHVMPLIDSIAVKDLTVEYSYSATDAAAGPGTGTATTKNTKTAQQLKITGKLLISVFELDLNYNYVGGKSWDFKARVNPQKANATIGDVISGLLDAEDGQLDLPAFVANTPFSDKGKADALFLSIEEKKAKAPAAITDGRPQPADPKDVPSSFQMMLRLRFGGDDLGLSLAFAQLKSTEWGPAARPKRLVKVALMGLPSIEVPLVGDLTQPFDQLYFMWVQDPPPAITATGASATSTSKPARVAGLTRSDIEQLNENFEADNKLVVKDKFKDPKPGDLLVGPGCHVAVITKDSAGRKSCLLAYQFMKPKDPAPAPALAGGSARLALLWAVDEPPRRLALAGTESKPEDDSGPSATAPFKKKAGPLSISNIGVKYKDKKIRIQFDAMFDMGPLAFSLIGFSIGLDIKSLDSVPSIDVQIEGLSAVFNKPPLTIAGIIRHENTGELDYYAGGLIIGFVPYQFMAAGFYGSATPKGAKTFTSMFVFAKLNGPLITLEFAEISGITGGFGYNSSVRLPRPEEVAEFPFVAPMDLGPADRALEVLMRLTDPGPTGWFYPQDGTYWFAAGMKISAFQMISLDAVIMVQFGTSIKLGIFGVALADIPTAASPLKYAHVELGIAIVVDFEYGVLKAEAQLSPRSYILHPDCHLTGGAALYYWFDAPRADLANVGQFVFTLGGFHQAYQVPVGYPNPPRLAISWNVASCLSITGQAYFAITPKACMAGGRLRAVFHAGPVKAWFDAWADFLINYKPFHFMASAGISVGCEFEVDLGIVSFSLSIELGAQLYLWGPPLAGRVHVDFWVASFDIDFGDSDANSRAVGLVEFYELVLQASKDEGKKSSAAPMAIAAAGDDEDEAEEEIVSPAAAAAAAVDAPALPPAVPIRKKNEGHVFLPQSGLLNPSDSPEKEQNPEWTVRAGTFSFVIGCKMAINSVKLDRIGDFDPEAEDDMENDLLMTYGSPDAGLDVYGKPMRLLKPMSSALTFQISQESVSGGQKTWRVDEHIKSVPRGLWAKYSAGEDPSSGNNNVGELLNSSKGSMPLLMGVQVTAPKAHKSRDPFPIYNIADATLVQLNAARDFPTPEASDSRWEPAMPEKDVAERYSAVLKAWTEPALGTGDGGQQGFVATWAAAMGWDSKKMSAGRMAALPKKMKSRFANLYVAAPLVTVA